MNKLIISIFAILIGFNSVAQTNVYDPEAKKILDEVSANAKKAQPFSIEFSNRLVDKQSNLDETTTGSVIVSGAKYQLKLGANMLYCDGKIVSTYYPEMNEVEIRNIADMDEGMNPVMVFDMYKKGFKYRLKDEQTVAGKKFYVIELYPENTKEKKYSRAQILVDKSTKQLYSFSTYFKDGKEYTLTLKNFKSKITVNDAEFLFNKSKYPDVEVTDLRE
jgi:outer membrane lipoprotein-sorting protein